MNQVKISQLKQMRVDQIHAIMPFEITSDGYVIGVFSNVETHAKVDGIKTKCPNCKFVYNVEKPDNAPYFFSCGIRRL